MKKDTRTKWFYGALAFALLPGALEAFQSDIKLTGPKDLVLSIGTREKVLEVGVNYLANDAEEALPQIGELDDPFSFKQAEPVLAVVPEDTASEAPAKPKKVEYDDATVLGVSAKSFSKKVRGAIARGETSYLQLEGGTLLKPGTSFPVRLPQAQEQTFTLTISEISPDGYTLQIGDATKRMSFDGMSRSNSIQLSNP
jgi:hypothetical protein